MNRTDRRKIIKLARGMPPLEKLKFFSFEARRIASPMTDVERVAAVSAGAALKGGVLFYHGGTAGRRPGDHLLPPAITGADPMGAGPDYLHRVENVFVTTCLHVARGYAQRFQNGCVYRVEPERPLIADPVYLRAAVLFRADPELNGEVNFAEILTAYSCPRAEVLEVLE